MPEEWEKDLSASKPPEIRLLDAEKCIERIEELFEGDPFEAVRSRPAAPSVAPSGIARWQERLTRRVPFWKLLGTAIATLGLGGFLGIGFGFLVWGPSSSAKPLPSAKKELPAYQSPSLESLPIIKETGAFVEQAKKMIEEHRPVPEPPRKIQSQEPPYAELRGTLGPSETGPRQKPLLTREQNQQTPVALRKLEGAKPTPPPEPPQEKKKELPEGREAMAQESGNKEEAAKEIAFALEVLETVKITKGEGPAITKATAAIEKAKSLTKDGRHHEAAKLARETAEQLLLESGP